MKTEIRMFKVGALGDCFLLRFIEEEEQFNILIDCGAYWNSDAAETRLKLIAQEIQELVGDNQLDIVVGTHQHNDHYSGFWFAKETFENIGAEHVWLSWMNEPGNEDAEAILEEHHNLRLALQNIRSALSLRGDQAGKALLEEVESLVDVNEDVRPNNPVFAAKKRISVPDEGLKTIRNMGPESYLHPGQIKAIFEEKVKVYVLGPPKNYKSLRDTNPNKGQSYDKHLKGLHHRATEVLKTIEAANDESANESFPFNSNFKNKLEESQTDLPKLIQQYFDNPAQRIDDSWTKSAEQLAIRLNSYTNNTSLVLAFELVESGKVLLFVGDAQMGNWLSWDKVEWEDGKEHLEQLLEQTVFYKVGHHGSHNSTLKPALEAMTHPELMAMIPVDKNDPNISSRKRPWKMPAAKLYERLLEKTKGRVLRMDEGPHESGEGNWEIDPEEFVLYWMLEI